MKEPPEHVSRPAGFGIRLVALLVDLLVFLAVHRSLDAIARRVWGPGVDGAPVQVLVVMFTLLFTALYAVVLHSLGGQTIGKMLVRVRVAAADGTPLPLGASLLRYFAYGVSLLPLGMGFVMAGLRSDKRALHDLLAGSRVERVPAPARAPAPAVYPDGTTPSGVA